VIRLIGAVLAEQHDEWAESRRYLGLDTLTKSQAVGTPPADIEEVPGTEIPALSALPQSKEPHRFKYATQKDLTRPRSHHRHHLDVQERILFEHNGSTPSDHRQPPSRTEKSRPHRAGHATLPPQAVQAPRD
jgi:putative transposase